MKLFLAPENKDAMNARSENARIQSLFHRCQVSPSVRQLLGDRIVREPIPRRAPKIGNPVCYNSPIGGNHAAANMGQ